MASSEPDSEVHCLRTTMPSMSRLRKARAFFHDLPGRSGFGVPSGAPASQARVSFVTRENVERSFMVLREGHQLDRSDLQHVQVTFHLDWLHYQYLLNYKNFTFNPLKRSGVRWLHFEVLLRAIHV